MAGSPLIDKGSVVEGVRVKHSDMGLSRTPSLISPSRAVGGFNKQIRQTIRMEAPCIAGIAIVLGFGFGAISLFYIHE